MSPLELPSGAPGGGGNTWQALQFCPGEVGVIAKAILLPVVQPPPLGYPSKESALVALAVPADPGGLGLRAILSPGHGATPGQCQA